MQMDSTTTAGVLLRFFCGRVGGVNGNINYHRTPGHRDRDQARSRHSWEVVSL
jgi:hypothetical protein